MKRAILITGFVASLTTSICCNRIGTCLSSSDGFSVRTYTYKVADGKPIEADVYRPGVDGSLPVVVWIHGGALIMGSRKGVPDHIVDFCSQQNVILISIDYRLAPETKLPEIIEDVQGAFEWLNEKGPELFGARTDKVVVVGASAGGYLTMMTGICVQPRPTALVSYYGYGDVDGDWYNQPSEEHAKEITLPEDEIHRNYEIVTEERGQYYRLLRKKGIWTRIVTGFDPETQQDELTPYCPVRNVTADYPPVIMIHGTADEDVPYEKSTDMKRELDRCNVASELITVPNCGHGLGELDEETRKDIYSRVTTFIAEHIK